MTADKQECVSVLVGAGLSIVKACLFVGIGRSTFYRPERDWRKADAAVIDAIDAVLEKSPRAGFWKCFGRINGHLDRQRLGVIRRVTINISV